MCVCVVTQSCLTLCDPKDCNHARLLCPWDFPARILEWVAISPTQGLNLGWEALPASSPPSSEVGGKPGEREVLGGHRLVTELLGDSGTEAPLSPSELQSEKKSKKWVFFLSIKL